MTDEKEQILAFARDISMGRSSSVQSVHWRITYHRNDVTGDKLTIEAIAPDYTVSSVMKRLTDAMSELKKYEETK